MNVAFFMQGKNPDYVRMAKMTIASVQSAMPGMAVWHLTDADTPMVEGATGVKRISEQMPMAVRRMTHNASLLGDWLLIDCDIIMKRDVGSVFDDDFDVALTDRTGTITNEAAYAKVMPYNLGVSFSRSPTFWKEVLKHLVRLPMQLQQWEGDQRIVCAMMKQGCKFDVNVLPGSLYNYPPKFYSDEGEGASLLHYKGNRKAYLMEAA